MKKVLVFGGLEVGRLHSWAQCVTLVVRRDPTCFLGFRLLLFGPANTMVRWSLEFFLHLGHVAHLMGDSGRQALIFENLPIRHIFLKISLFRGLKKPTGPNYGVGPLLVPQNQHLFHFYI